MIQFCPECGSDNTTQSTPTNERGKAEWYCYDCGAYFVADAEMYEEDDDELS